MAQVLGSPVHELHGERDGARLLITVVAAALLGQSGSGRSAPPSC
jgi:hypothetical protein